MTEKDIHDIKMAMFVVLAGKVKGEPLATYLTFIADKSGISEPEDFEVFSDYSSTGVFVLKSMELIDDGKFDEWADYFKEKLLQEEQYELLNELHL